MPAEYYFRKYPGELTRKLIRKQKKQTRQNTMHNYVREVQLSYKKKRVKDDIPTDKSLVNPEIVYKMFSDLQNEGKEKLITISLDTHLKILCFEVVAIGSVSSIHARPIEVLRASIPLNPYGFILVHNHPSGDPSPSQADENFTYDLMFIAEKLGLRFHDHIIIGRENYFSFAKEGLMIRLEKRLQQDLP